MMPRRLSAASRPLTAFYALAQAGEPRCRSLSKLHHRSHGLTLSDPGQDLMRRNPGSRAWLYQAVSDTVGSPLLQKAQLGQLWGSDSRPCSYPPPSGLWAKAMRLVTVLSQFAFARRRQAGDVLFEPMPASPTEAAID